MSCQHVANYRGETGVHAARPEFSISVRQAGEGRGVGGQGGRGVVGRGVLLSARAPALNNHPPRFPRSGAHGIAMSCRGTKQMRAQSGVQDPLCPNRAQQITTARSGDRDPYVV